MVYRGPLHYLAPPPPPLLSASSQSSCVPLVVLTEKELVEESNHMTARRPGFSINHSILSGESLLSFTQL